MRMAVIGDIHGNSAALKAVLTDIDALGVDVIVNLGDHFSGPLDVKGTADQLFSRDMTHILGNHDRWLIEQAPTQMGLSDLQAYGQLESGHRDWPSLKPTAHIDDIFICHGTPSSDVIYWMEEVKPNGSVCMAT